MAPGHCPDGFHHTSPSMQEENFNSMKSVSQIVLLNQFNAAFDAPNSEANYSGPVSQTLSSNLKQQHKLHYLNQ